MGASRNCCGVMVRLRRYFRAIEEDKVLEYHRARGRGYRLEKDNNDTDR